MCIQKKLVRGKSKGGETGVEDGGEDKAHLENLYRQATFGCKT